MCRFTRNGSARSTVIPTPKFARRSPAISSSKIAAEGGAVKKGDLLFEIDPRPFQATLDAAQARLAQDVAQSGKTELDVKRYTPLARDQAISQEQLDDAVQANLAAKAAIQADQAAVETATLNLEFCRIISPVDGIAGTALAQIGDLVGPGGALLTTVSTADPNARLFQHERAGLSYFPQSVYQRRGIGRLPIRYAIAIGPVGWVDLSQAGQMAFHWPAN